MTQSMQFPGPEPGDPEDVAWTLQTAGAMWARGEAHEAVRWLRRAAEAAEEGGNDLRAVTLARAAADLTTALELPPSIPPPPSPDETSRMPPLPLSRPDHPPIQPVDDADGAWGESDYTVPGMSAMDASPARPPLPRSRPNHPPPSRPAPSSGAAHPPPSVRPSTAPAASAIRQRQALRVAVEPSSTEKNLLLVRPLAEDEPVPAGAHEAILTALEPGAHLLSKKR